MSLHSMTELGRRLIGHVQSALQSIWAALASGGATVWAAYRSLSGAERAWLALLAAVCLLMAAAPVTRRCRRRLQVYEDGRSANGGAGSRPRSKSAADLSGPGLNAVPEPETVAHHVRSMLSADVVLGLLFLAVLLAFFPMNARILAEGFEVLLNRPGAVLAVLSVGGWHWDVTDLQLYGVALSLALLLDGAAFSAFAAAGSRLRWLVFACALAPIVTFEVGMAWERGRLVAADSGVGATELAAFGAIQAWVCAVTEILAGHLAVSHALVPAIQAAGWLVVSPFRIVARAMRTRGTPEDTRGRPGVFVRIGAYADEAIVEPLREVDRHAAAFVARRISRRAQPAGPRHA